MIIRTFYGFPPYQIHLHWSDFYYRFAECEDYLILKACLLPLPSVVRTISVFFLLTI